MLKDIFKDKEQFVEYLKETERDLRKEVSSSFVSESFQYMVLISFISHIFSFQKQECNVPVFIAYLEDNLADLTSWIAQIDDASVRNRALVINKKIMSACSIVTFGAGQFFT